MMEEKLIENFLTYYFFNLEQNEPGNNKKICFLICPLAFDKLKNEFIHDRLCNVIKSRNYYIFCFFYTIETFSKKSMLYLKGLFTTHIYAPIIEQSQLACLTKSWRLKCKYSPSAFSSLLMQLPPQIGVRILQRPLLSIEASRANILFCFSNLYSSKL